MKKLELLLCLVAAMLVVGLTAYAQTETLKITFTWDAYPDAADGFVLHYGPASRGTATSPAQFKYPTALQVPATATEFSATMPPGTWYVTMTAYRNGEPSDIRMESDYSNELRLVIPTKPAKVRIGIKTVEVTASSGKVSLYRVIFQAQR